MVKFLIATHGFLADGFKSSVEVLMGKETADSIMTVNAFVEGGEPDPKSMIEEICESISDQDELIIFTDLMYGSVNQFALPYTEKKNVYILSGTNFPLICEVISKLTFGSEESKVVSSEIEEIVDKAREQIVFVEDFSRQEEVKSEEEDFFE